MGVFIHMGVFSVPGVSDAWFWYHWKTPNKSEPEVTDYVKKNLSPMFTYQDFAKDFKCEMKPICKFI